MEEEGGVERDDKPLADEEDGRRDVGFGVEVVGGEDVGTGDVDGVEGEDEEMQELEEW